MKRQTRKPKLYSIDHILWSNFTLFSVLLLVFVSLFCVTTVRNSLRKQVISSINSVTIETYRYLEHPESTSPEDLSRYLLSVSSANGMQIYVLNSQGEVVAPTIEGLPGSDQNYFELLEQHREELRSNTEEGYRGFVETSKETAFFLGIVNDDTYLYISRSLDLVNDSLKFAQIQILLLSGFVLLASFLLSGYVAMRLSHPFAEVANKAKKLANGDFSVDFNGKYYYREMGELAAGLNDMRDELSRSSQMQKELIANVSHDMKTPLTMIKAYASMIQEISGDNKEKRQMHTKVIIDEADRLTTLVNDILNLSKIQAGMDTLQLSVFNFSEFIYSIIQKFEYLQETQNYIFETDIESDLYIEADRGKIGQVVYNLIGNAVTYTGEDKKIFVSLKREKQLLHFRVRDTGKGIPENEIAAIWDRYYRSSEAHKRPIQGTGLGLSIVKTICEKHKLHFGVDSEVGKGSTFYVDFPLCEEDKET